MQLDIGPELLLIQNTFIYQYILALLNKCG
jgi:hypothetical protein